MTGTATDDVDPKKMTSAELHAHFTRMLVGHAPDVDTHLGDVHSKLSDAMDKIAGLEESFNAKLDAKFQEVLAHLPPQPQPGIHVQHACRVPLIPPPIGTVTAAAAAAAASEVTTQDGYAANEGRTSPKMKTSSRRMRSNNLHLAVHGNTTAILAHLYERYVMMNMLPY
jgi:hypothetical protein